MVVDKNVVWGGVVVFVSLIGSITFLVQEGKDYQAIVSVISWFAVMALQIFNAIQTRTVKEKVNGQNTRLLDAVLPPAPANTTPQDGGDKTP